MNELRLEAREWVSVHAGAPFELIAVRAELEARGFEVLWPTEFTFQATGIEPPGSRAELTVPVEQASAALEFLASRRRSNSDPEGVAKSHERKDQRIVWIFLAVAAVGLAFAALSTLRAIS